jgi:hypothetical protein
MPLYQWESPTLADYSDGTIFVSAASISAARNKVRECLKADLNDKSDPHRRVRAERLIAEVNRKPEICEFDVCFVVGSA